MWEVRDAAWEVGGAEEVRVLDLRECGRPPTETEGGLTPRVARSSRAFLSDSSGGGVGELGMVMSSAVWMGDPSIHRVGLRYVQDQGTTRQDYTCYWTG